MVEHYAAGEGEGKEAPKVSLPLCSQTTPSLLACELYQSKTSCLMLLLLLKQHHGKPMVDVVVML